MKVIKFAPGLIPVLKHGEHDQKTHGSWANSSERSAKEIEVQQRITQIEHQSYPVDEDGMSSNRVTAIYETKDGTKIKLLHDNEKTADGDILMTTKAYLFVEGGVKQIADLESSRSKNVISEAGAVIDRIQVEPEYQRLGIATAMLNLARSYSQDGIKIEHSFSLTDDAKGWSGIVKHLQGQHDQQTHGRWADSGLPHELENVKDSLQKYFDLGAIAKVGEITRARRKYEAKADGSGYEVVTVREPVRDSLDQPFMTFRAPYDYDDPEGAQIFKEYEAKMLGGNYEEIELAARQEALDAGMGSRQALYYGQAIASRASLYVTMHNEALRQQAAEVVYSRDFGDYKDRYEEFFAQRASTMKTLSENISKAYPVIAIETEDFLGVIKDGRFKTQHETRNSNGAYKPALRKEAELAIAGVPLDTKSSERPIYGYLAVQNDGTTANTSLYNTDKWNVNNTGVGSYGEVRVVLKDSVKERTSYTIPDSLDRYAIPQPLSRNGKADLINAGAYHDLSMSHGGYQREGYAEAQVYGGVKLSDIKAIYVVPDYDYVGGKVVYKDTKNQISAIRSALKSKGVAIPVEFLAVSPTPIDRDGDGFIYDGTDKERTAPTKGGD